MKNNYAKKKLLDKVLNTIKYVALIIYACISIYPLFWMIVYSLKSTKEIFNNPFGLPKSIYYQNYISAVTKYNMFRFFLNSFIVTVSTVVFVLIFASMYSYATARMKWKLQKAAYIYISIGMFIPVQIILLPLLIIVRDMKLANTLTSLIAPYVAFGLPIATILFYAFYRTLPKEIEESAAIEGANIFSIFFKIMLPFVKPAMMTVVIFTVINTWNEFVMALVLITSSAKKTLPLGLVSFQGQFSTNYGAMGAALTIASIPTVIIYLFFNAPMERAITVGAAIKG